MPMNCKDAEGRPMVLSVISRQITEVSEDDLAFLGAIIHMVAMLPSRLLRGSAALRVVESPVEVPGYEMAMLWHERSHRDPAHQWLRAHIVDSV